MNHESYMRKRLVQETVVYKKMRRSAALRMLIKAESDRLTRPYEGMAMPYEEHKAVVAHLEAQLDAYVERLSAMSDSELNGVLADHMLEIL